MDEMHRTLKNPKNLAIVQYCIHKFGVGSNIMLFLAQIVRTQNMVRNQGFSCYFPATYMSSDKVKSMATSEANKKKQYNQGQNYHLYYHKS